MRTRRDLDHFSFQSDQVPPSLDEILAAANITEPRPLPAPQTPSVSGSQNPPASGPRNEANNRQSVAPGVITAFDSRIEGVEGFIQDLSDTVKKLNKKVDRYMYIIKLLKCWTFIGILTQS